MDNLVFACVAPHGALVIPLISGPEGVRTRGGRAGMEELGRRMEAAQPETTVIRETHSMLVDGAIALLDSARVHGELGAPHPVVPPESPEHHFSLTFDVDRDLNAAIVAAARASNVPAGRVRHCRHFTHCWRAQTGAWRCSPTRRPPTMGCCAPRTVGSRVTRSCACLWPRLPCVGAHAHPRHRRGQAHGAPGGARSPGATVPAWRPSATCTTIGL